MSDTRRIRRKNPAARRRFLHVRLNDAEYALLERRAGEPPTSEWLRGFLLERATRSEFEEALMAEALSLRAIVLNTLGTLVPGAADRIAEFADREKLEKARRKLKEAV